MKKLIITALMFAGITISAQETKFGVTAGYNMSMGKLTETGLKSDRTVTTSDSGFFVGLFADFKINDKFGVQPELHYTAVYSEGNESNMLTMPILAKYYITDKFSVMAGPMLDLVLDEVSDNANTFGIGAAIGVAYDFTENIYATARYSFGLSNRIDQANTTVKGDFFQIGIGYRF